jgi:hypothetical protein
MFHIENAPTNTTKCNWCKNNIKKGVIRLRFAPSKGYNYYWHQDCGIKYLEGLLIMLKKGEKGVITKEEAEIARSSVGNN